MTIKNQLSCFCLLFTVGVVLCSTLDTNELFKKAVTAATAKTNASEELFNNDNVSATFNEYCPNGAEKLDTVVGNVTECLEQFDKGEETLCSASQTALPTCLNYMVEFLEECLKEGAKTLPRFLVKSLMSAIKFLCGINVETMLELGNTCYMNDTSYSSVGISKIDNYIMKHINEKTIPSNTSLCSQLTEVKPLLIGHVQESCVNNITRNAFIGLYLAILKPCGEDNQIKDSDNQL